MPGRIVRTKTAKRVTELLGSREGRKHLNAYGWEQGMPVVVALPMESVNDVMGLVSMHGRPVLVAMLLAETDELKFLYVSIPNSALQSVPLETDASLIQQLFVRASNNGGVTFRVKYWESSAVAHPIPEYRSSNSEAYAQRSIF